MALLGRKKENSFIRLLRKQAEKLQEGVGGLLLFVREGDKEGASTVQRTEKESDEIRRVLIDELHDTFITPFDREDIFQLSKVQSKHTIYFTAEELAF